MRFIDLEISGYRSYRSTQRVRFDPNLSVLSGRNNVGKTALLRALFMLRGGDGTFEAVANDCEITVTFVMDRNDLLAGLTDVGAGSFVEERLPASQNVHISCSLAKTVLTPSGAEAVANVGVYAAQVLPLTVRRLAVVGSELALSIHPLAAVHTPTLWWDNVRASHASDAASFQPAVAARGLLCHAVVAELRRQSYIAPRRLGALSARFGIHDILESDGGNLSAVVATLYINQRDTVFRELESLITQAFPEVAGIDVRMTGDPPNAEILVRYPGGTTPPVPLALCGTGIEQLLMLGAAILTTPGQVILVDEPHAFLHPSAETALLRFIRLHGDHQYIVATHSAVFLSAVKLDQIRLLTLTDEGTSVSDVSDIADVLTEVGITAAQLWSSDGVLWIEGPSDVGVADRVRSTMDPELTDASVRVVGMPDWIRSVAGSADRAAAAIRFCDAVLTALAPMRIESLFLFDGDERSDALRQEITDATGGRTWFLDCREIENLLLDPDAITEVLSRQCVDAGVEPPTSGSVAAELARLIANVNDSRLYRGAVTEPDATRVVGSRVLQELWWTYTKSDYDKVTDGPALAQAVLRRDPEALSELRRLLKQLADRIRGSRGVRPVVADERAVAETVRHQGSPATDQPTSKDAPR